MIWTCVGSHVLALVWGSGFEQRDHVGGPAGGVGAGVEWFVAPASSLTATTIAWAQLAPVVLKRLMPVLQRIVGTGVGVLLVEQFALLAISLADRIALLDRGSINQVLSAATVRADPSLIDRTYGLAALTTTRPVDEK